MRNAHEIIKMLISTTGMDSEKKRPVRSFLHNILLGVATHAELSREQENLLTATIQEVKCNQHTAVLKDSQRSQAWAMQIAMWINGAHVANRCP